MMQQQNVAGNILGVGNSTKQDMRNNIFVIIGVKLIFLVALLGLLFAIFKKIFHRIRRRKENVRKVHIVRQMPKARTRVVRIAKRK
jgi:flagellar biogenesis protein FliO